MTHEYLFSVKIADLRLADVVKLSEGPWGTGVVSQIKDGKVTIFRPYGTTDNFSYGGGVQAYVGFGHAVYDVTEPRTLLVYDRKATK